MATAHLTNLIQVMKHMFHLKQTVQTNHDLSSQETSQDLEYLQEQQHHEQ